MKYLLRKIEKSKLFSNQVSKNITFAFFIKGGSMVVMLLTIPILYKFLGDKNFGLWMLLISFNTWITILDIGLGSNLKNELSKSISEGNNKLSKILISTTYFSILIIAVIITILFFVSLNYVQWENILNLSKGHSESLTLNLNTIVLILFVSFIIQILLSPYQAIFSATQKSGLIGIINFGSNLVILIILYISNKILIQDSFSLCLIIYSLIPIIISFVGTIILFKKIYPELKPSLNDIDKFTISILFKNSAVFFVLQITAVIMYQSMSILIAQYGDYSDVTEFNIYYKYFSIVYIIFVTFMNPLWPTSTEYFIKKQYNKLFSLTTNYVLLWGIFVLSLVFLYFFKDELITLWIGNSIETNDKNIGLYVCIFTIILGWNNIFISVINGTGKIKIEFALCVLVIVLYFPLVNFLSSYIELKVQGVLLTNIICLLPFSILMPIQVYLLLKRQTKGIWNKGLYEFNNAKAEF